jgi:hypothetical protein
MRKSRLAVPLAVAAAVLMLGVSTYGSTARTSHGLDRYDGDRGSVTTETGAVPATLPEEGCFASRLAGRKLFAHGEPASRLAALIAGQKQGQKAILILEEGLGDTTDWYYVQAARNLGHEPLVTTNWDVFYQAMVDAAMANFIYDLIIVNSISTNPTQTDMYLGLHFFRVMGSGMIFSYWNAATATDEAFLDYMGVRLQSPFAEPRKLRPVYAQHPVFRTPNRIGDIEPTFYSEGPEGSNMVALPNGVTLASFAALPDSAAIILTRPTRELPVPALVNSFKSINYLDMDADNDDKPDAVELFENEIHLLLEGNATLPAPLPVAGQDFTLAFPDFAPAGASVQISYWLGGVVPEIPQMRSLRADGKVSLSVTIPDSFVTPRGLEYYVTVNNGGVFTDYPPGGSSNAVMLRVGLDNQRLPNLTAEAYTLIGFPFEVNPNSVAQVFVDDLGAPNRSAWRLGHYSQALDSYLEYDAAGPVVAGKGFWLNVRNGTRPGASGYSTIPDTTIGDQRFVRLILHQGWNQISDPFAFTIDWTARIADAAIENTLFRYLGSESNYGPTELMNPYEGYWVNNNSDGPAWLLLPYLEAILAKAAPPPAGGWQVGLELAAGGLTARGMVVGARPGARDGRDPGDYSLPPSPPVPHLALGSRLPGEGSGAPLLAGDFRSTNPEGWRFDLHVRGDARGPARLQLAHGSRLPEEFSLVVRDPQSGQAFAMDPREGVVLPRSLSGGEETFELLVGSPAWLQEEAGQAEILPGRVRLAQNAPNPFNPETKIAFALPVPAFARLTVHDAAGRRVATLCAQELSAGEHRLSWNGRDGDGRAAASGLYFYRLEAGGEILTRRMLLVR